MIELIIASILSTDAIKSSFDFMEGDLVGFIETLLLELCEYGLIVSHESK